MLSSRTAHILQCFLLLSIVLILESLTGALKWSSSTKDEVEINPWEEYGYLPTVFLYFLRLLTFLALPQVIFNVLGLTLFNTFPEKVVLKGSPLIAPFLCVRVVTRGDYPDLVKKNVTKNVNLCLEVGLENFIVEVVTDRLIPGLSGFNRVREVVVPPSYTTKTGALFKARALQYCLEDDVNILNDSDWIVHLDEETILTDNAIRGILNFVLDGKHQFGQGVITYANDHVVNWMTTLADSFRVADDMGKLRAQFYLFHKPYFSWKGSYVVTQVGAERKVSFDNGPDGSVAEDCFFGMKAFNEGYSFNFIEGEMWEKSPFTIWDFLQQRKRWMQGIFLVVHSAAIPWRKKILLAISLYSWVTLPLTTSNIVFAWLAPIPCTPLVDFLCAFIGAMNVYMYVFGVIKSFSLHRMGPLRLIVFIVGALATIPFNVMIENIAVVWGLFGNLQFRAFMQKVTNMDVCTINKLFFLLDYDYVGELNFTEFLLICCCMIASKDQMSKEFLQRHVELMVEILDDDYDEYMPLRDFNVIGSLMGWNLGTVSRLYEAWGRTFYNERYRIQFEGVEFFMICLIDHELALNAQRRAATLRQIKRRRLWKLRDHINAYYKYLALPPPPAMWAILTNTKGKKDTLPVVKPIKEVKEQKGCCETCIIVFGIFMCLPWYLLYVILHLLMKLRSFRIGLRWIFCCLICRRLKPACVRCLEKSKRDYKYTKDPKLHSSLYYYRNKRMRKDRPVFHYLQKEQQYEGLIDRDNPLAQPWVKTRLHWEKLEKQLYLNKMNIRLNEQLICADTVDVKHLYSDIYLKKKKPHIDNQQPTLLPSPKLSKKSRKKNQPTTAKSLTKFLKDFTTAEIEKADADVVAEENALRRGTIFL